MCSSTCTVDRDDTVCMAAGRVLRIPTERYGCQYWTKARSGEIKAKFGRIFSSPEPLGSQGELIVYPSSRRPSSVVRRPSSS